MMRADGGYCDGKGEFTFQASKESCWTDMSWSGWLCELWQTLPSLGLGFGIE